MTEEAGIPEGETGFDRVLAFTLPERNARGRVVRLGPVLDTILSAHDYPVAIRQLLAEALVVTVLLGSLLKNDGSQLTLQAQSDDGIVDLLVCDFRGGEIRGYVRHDAERLAALEAMPSLTSLLGSGYLAVTFDIGESGQRYQGIVPLVGVTLAESCENYFAQSEQIPTLIRIAVRAGSSGCIAAGFLVQHLPDGEEGRERLHVRMDHPEWEHVAALGGSVRADELASRDLSLEAIVWRLFHDEAEIRVEPGSGLSRGCRCTEEHYRSILSRFAEEDRIEMRDDDGLVSIDCAFCSRLFRIEI
ncbi:Hsp33 family molecular chaperone HslO [Novosphingobium sp. TH158]|uniref:Hsp33 family molecular chaperone HslO n=1 Tax=Novosphingobium sp. TH158 TaxID=2067455 RepID=UPI000C7984AD|nr:Hsp33 family molecular chaperone HslO [Novosphingobium sp. TH158]PLK27423.1 molecular chaperone Hsp33 [Novosphingobium sp. TH158]